MTDIITINSKGIVPNHLNDTNIFCRYSNNRCIEVDPKEIYFTGYKINEKNYQEIKFTNISDEICRFHIIPPVSKYFRLQYKKPERLVPGFFVTCTIIFSPDKVRNYNDFLKIHTKDSENNIVVPIYAYPAIVGLDVPRNIKFPVTAVGKSSRRQICLHSDSEMDFDFEIVITHDHPAIKVDPLNGVIPAKGDKVISLLFSPRAYVTCEKTINIYVNQYNFKPIVCSIFGTSQPGLDRKQLVELIENEQTENSNLISIVKLESKRRSLGLQGSVATKSVKLSEKIVDGKLTRQQLKVDFESRLLENINNERQNQLRWQTCRGVQPVDEKEVALIMQQRERALKEYQLKIREQSSLFNCYKNNRVITNNWVRTIRSGADNVTICDNIVTPQFIPECWIVRRFALDRFRSAAWRIIIDYRLAKRLKKLIESGGDYHEVDRSHMKPGGENLVFVRNLNALSEERLPKQELTCENRFNMSEYKLMLPLQPQYEFESLIVPLQMHVVGYERIDNTTLSYLPQKSPYSMKSAPVVDATSTTDEESHVLPITYNGCPDSLLTKFDDKDRSLVPYCPSGFFYDKHSFFPLYYYKNELLEAKDPIEMEWRTPKSSFLVSKKSVKSITSDHLISNALTSSLLSANVPGLMSADDLKYLDYQTDNGNGRSITRSMMIEEFPILDSIMDGGEIQGQ